MIKNTQSTPVKEINPVTNPENLTIIDRYAIASHWCRGKSVLDAACGQGHGSMILKALGARKVFGVDFDEESIAYAKESYDEKSVSFEVKDLTDTKENFGAVFDCVVSIETFEHLPRCDVIEYLKNLRDACTPNGKIIITTPIRRSRTFIYDGGTHLYEYNENELVAEINRVFRDCAFELNSLGEFRVGEGGMLHTELMEGVGPNSKLFFVVIDKGKRRKK